ncbi:MAG: hypothetical protein KGK07_16760 [Chloroflexota bacterium]|nr:hypothetical protein [Chloroflexota bacterium]
MNKLTAHLIATLPLLAPPPVLSAGAGGQWRAYVWTIYDPTHHQPPQHFVYAFHLSAYASRAVEEEDALDADDARAYADLVKAEVVVELHSWRDEWKIACWRDAGPFVAALARAWGEALSASLHAAMSALYGE